VGLWAGTVSLLEGEMIRLFPAHADSIAARARRLDAQLRALDAWVAERIASIPPSQRILITAHDAFGYFGDRYGIEVRGLQGVSTLAEAGLKDMEQLVDAIVARRIKAIFVESSVPRRAIEAVQAACRDRGHEVAIGGELFSDAMGAAASEAGTYPGMVRHNVNAIVEALQ
jgi:manganese/zinc/iron transport system substrate-binding protein